MTNLSPAAQAVMDAYYKAPVDNKLSVAAALRAVVLHAQPKAHIEDIDYVQQHYVDGWEEALGVILAIADELENNDH